LRRAFGERRQYQQERGLAPLAPVFSYKKKTVLASEQERPDVAAARRCWRESQASLDPERLIFIDETHVRLRLPAARASSSSKSSIVISPQAAIL
jgi:hypothetical protein